MGYIKRQTTLKWKVATFHKVLMKKYEGPCTFQPPFTQPFLLSASAKVLETQVASQPQSASRAPQCVLSWFLAIRMRCIEFMNY